MTLEYVQEFILFNNTNRAFTHFTTIYLSQRIKVMRGLFWPWTLGTRQQNTINSSMRIKFDQHNPWPYLKSCLIYTHIFAVVIARTVYQIKKQKSQVWFYSDKLRTKKTFRYDIYNSLIYNCLQLFVINYWHTPVVKCSTRLIRRLQK